MRNLNNFSIASTLSGTAFISTVVARNFVSLSEVRTTKWTFLDKLSVEHSLPMLKTSTTFFSLLAEKISISFNLKFCNLSSEKAIRLSIYILKTVIGYRLLKPSWCVFCIESVLHESDSQMMFSFIPVSQINESQFILESLSIPRDFRTVKLPMRFPKVVCILLPSRENNVLFLMFFCFRLLF